MLATIDKVQAGGNNIVQIVVTRSCNLYTCSNCTQLLPFRQDTLHMSLECFREACRSLKGWPGVAALFGGNPCSHPQFPELCKILLEEFPNQRQRGLWTNDLLRHGEVAKRVFWPNGRFNLNVHGSKKAADQMRQWLPSIPIYGETGEVHHAPMLINYRSYGYTDQQWILMRERCDINQKWSSGIYQGSDGHPYAYFCEVAGSLIGVLHGRHEEVGIPAVPGWWREPMSKFQHQVHQCCDQGCGVPLRMKGHNDTEDTYDISPEWVELTNKRTGKVLVQVHETHPGNVHESTDYAGLRRPKRSKP